MNKKEFIKLLKNELNVSEKQLNNSIKITINLIKDILIKGEKLNIYGFGCFCLKEKNERFYYNPFLNKKILVAPQKVITFKANKKLL